MVMHFARIALRPAGLNRDVAVEIDGTEYKSVTRAIDIHGVAGQCPSIELTLNVVDVDVDIEARVVVDALTAALLCKLGWTPPRQL